jgi:hypothetical protein
LRLKKVGINLQCRRAVSQESSSSCCLSDNNCRALDQNSIKNPQDLTKLFPIVGGVQEVHSGPVNDIDSRGDCPQLLIW